LSNENNKVLGIITIADLVKLYDKEVEKIVKVRNPSIPDIGKKGDEIDKSNDGHLRDKTTNKD
jgi:chloride channel protein, CIC family